MTRNELTRLIVERLERDLDEIRREFNTPKGTTATRHAAIDNLLPEDVARKIYESFPEVEKMRLMSSFREQKYTSKSFDQFDPLLLDISLAVQAPEVIKTVEKITGMEEMVGDPHFYAGGLSAMTKGHYLNPHIDNSHDGERKMYRVLNLLYYVSPDWKSENGGNLELWDEEVRQPTEIPSLFNRLVLMETNEKSFHSVNQVQVDRARCCVSNYYFSPNSPNNGRETFHVTFFKARPEQPFRRLISSADGNLRTFIRKFAKDGVAKKDVYEAAPDADKK